MFNAQAWARQLAGEGCAVCAGPSDRDDSLWVATLASGHVRLQPDASFRGYCILYFRRHVVELYDLTTAERADLIEDLRRLSQAIAACCRPAKLNYACLGNEVPHLHWHIVPRYPDDGWWGRSFSACPPEQRRAMAAEEYRRLKEALTAALHATRPAG